METEISLRALKFCKYKGITAADFERVCGIANGMVKKLSENTRKQTYDRISKAFSDLNINWLRTGEGEMLVNKSSINQNGQGNVLQDGHAGHDLTQTNNSDKILIEFINGLKSQNKLTERAMSQTDRAFDVIEDQKDMMKKLINMLQESRKE